MRKIREYGPSTALLEPAQANENPRSYVSRLQKYPETPEIPDPVLEETANADAGEPFLRTGQRVPVRRRGGGRFANRFGWSSRWTRIAAALMVLVVLAVLAGAVWETRALLLRDSLFRLASTQNIQVTGNRVVTDRQVFSLFAPDLSRSILHVPLAQRQAQLQQIRWVRRATVMRLWPNHIRVNVLERTPIAFARDGNFIRLVDDDGVLLDLTDAAAQHYSFPVLDGISSGDPLSTRAAQIELYRQFVQALDAGGGHIASTLSEVDLSDPEDIRALFTGGPHQPWVHFGTSDFLPRYQAYAAHLNEWLQQYPQLRSVDMRYGRQVVLDTGNAPEPAATASPTIQGAAEIEPEAPARTDASPAHPAPVHTAKKKTGSVVKKRVAAARHHATKTKHKHAPERGHPVRHPIMHVVGGA